MIVNVVLQFCDGAREPHFEGRSVQELGMRYAHGPVLCRKCAKAGRSADDVREVSCTISENVRKVL